jgi:8-oxo-dGTP pyrophosphatase MutT (NUDIX family)
MGKSDTTKASADIVVLDDQNRILMQLRDKEGEHSFKGCWGLPGGSVEEGETPDEAIKREFKEETGCSCNPEFVSLGKYTTEDGRVIDKYIYKHIYDKCPIQVLEGQKFEFKTFEDIEKIENKNPHSELVVKKILRNIPGHPLSDKD